MIYTESRIVQINKSRSGISSKKNDQIELAKKRKHSKQQRQKRLLNLPINEDETPTQCNTALLKTCHLCNTVAPREDFTPSEWRKTLLTCKQCNQHDALASTGDAQSNNSSSFKGKDNEFGNCYACNRLMTSNKFSLAQWISSPIEAADQIGRAIEAADQIGSLN